jgi:hypothetical protein
VSEFDPSPAAPTATASTAPPRSVAPWAGVTVLLLLCAAGAAWYFLFEPEAKRPEHMPGKESAASPSPTDETGKATSKANQDEVREVGELLRQAKAFRDIGELEKARGKLAEAVALAPDNEEAKRRLQNVKQEIAGKEAAAKHSAGSEKKSHPQVDPKRLVGLWKRNDGNYLIKITESSRDLLKAAYFNPNPINVETAKLSLDDRELKVFIKLNDQGYPGCIYELVYDRDQDVLVGTYFQAAKKQTYEIRFRRNQK